MLSLQDTLYKSGPQQETESLPPDTQKILIKRINNGVRKYPETSNTMVPLLILEVKEEEEKIIRTRTLKGDLPGRSWSHSTKEMPPKQGGSREEIS